MAPARAAERVSGGRPEASYQGPRCLARCWARARSEIRMRDEGRERAPFEMWCFFKRHKCINRTKELSSICPTVIKDVVDYLPANTFCALYNDNQQRILARAPAQQQRWLEGSCMSRVGWSSLHLAGIGLYRRYPDYPYFEVLSERRVSLYPAWRRVDVRRGCGYSLQDGGCHG